ncbi:hypothetical protein [Neolewinella agarilytica]|uniref:Uncharacterized protein n=1 Tax=Neolewinella agarilytica TaxID=478744 RepID=A0A1H9LTY4_9BACT|nr:hypothetical protein [Neolewinella agarilytica]SER14667.1 hypothetical protein SAMN05444359_12566 [Neolewinella agarilytica]
MTTTDLYASELEEAYEKIMQSEHVSETHIPPTGLSLVAWYADRITLLNGLRLYARFLSYPLAFNEKNVSLKSEDFNGLLATVARRLEQIKSEPPLYAYWRTTELVQLPREDADTPKLISEHTDYLLKHKEDLDLEDYIYSLSHLGNYCFAAINNQVPGYLKIAMDLAKYQIEGKYSTGVKGVKCSLPSLLFISMMMIILLNDKKLDWTKVKMKGIEPNDSFTLKDWTEAFIKAYRLKLHSSRRISCIAQCRMRRDFHLEDFVGAAKQIPLIDVSENDLIKLSTRRMELMIHDELIHAGNKLSAKAANKLGTNPPALVKTMRANINDLAKRKEIYLYHADHFMQWLDAFTDLRELRRHYENRPDSVERSQYLWEKRTTILAKLGDYRHISGEWLRKKLQCIDQ